MGVMVDYRYLLLDASSGTVMTEVPLTVSSFVYKINGWGQLNATIPRDHPKAADTLWSIYQSTNADREITVLRDDFPEWNGPVMMLGAALSSPLMTVTAAEPSAYLSMRVLEENKVYNSEDIFDIIRDLCTYAVSKESNGLTSGGTSINAALPNFTVAPASALSGVTKSISFPAGPRPTISDLIINNLIPDPSFGLDFRMDYTTGSSRQTCQRTLTFASPGLGVTVDRRLTEHVLVDFTKNEDWSRAANRTHVVGNGYTDTLQNTGSIANGDILRDGVFDRTDTSDVPTLQAFNKDARRASQPPVITMTATFKPGKALPWGFCQVGDTIALDIGGTSILHSAGHWRVIQIEVQPPSVSQDELVTLTFGVALDSLGT